MLTFCCMFTHYDVQVSMIWRGENNETVRSNIVQARLPFPQSPQSAFRLSFGQKKISLECVCLLAHLSDSWQDRI